MTNIVQNLAEIMQDLSKCYNKNVSLIGVSKMFPEAYIVEAYNAGLIKFGENYPQELAAKASNLNEYDIEWHFIGNIQSNKTRLIAENASWVHTIAKAQHAKRLNDQRPKDKPALQVLIEVNISNEKNKYGLISFDDILELATFIHSQPNLELRGLMGMASDTENEYIIRQQFNTLSELKNKLNQHGFDLSELSMGMSNDYKIAVECGATFIRIGSKIFGARNYDN